MSEMLQGSLKKVLTRIDSAKHQLYDGNIREGSEDWKRQIRKAVEQERQREYPCNAEDAAERAFGYDKLDDDKTG